MELSIVPGLEELRSSRMELLSLAIKRKQDAWMRGFGGGSCVVGDKGS